MGIISDFKRLFWVKKAIAESAADKAGEKGKEIAHDLSEKASDAWEKGKDIAEDIGHKVTEKAKEGYKEVKEFTANLMDKKEDWTQDKPADLNKAESLTSKTSDQAEKASSKLEDTAEDLG